ncbi:hypothetical protein JW851_01185 [Candidatus Woesearchaeota archaeon]|nr:hypothetical protein [Candidatus Woesearchaeota archaeon]
MKLIPEQRWIKKIVELEEESKKNKKVTKIVLKKAILEAIQRNILKKRFGILFSGGVDSTLIAHVCKKAKADFICYCVGLENSPDLFWAEEIAKKYKFKLKTKILKSNEMELLFKRTKKMLKHVDTLSIGVGSVLATAIELGKKDKIKDFFTGLGSEEIFAGYHFHGEAKNVHKECWKRLKSMWKRDLRRDAAVANKLNVNLLTPFLDEALIKTAMAIPAKRKIDQKNKKIILREIAQDLGLDKKFAWRSKKAAQYGTWFDKSLARLARNKGFIFKQNYIKSL